MIIKERPVISWLLNSNSSFLKRVKVAHTSNLFSALILQQGIMTLANYREQRIYGHLPEMIMPSFEKRMKESIPAFDQVQQQLFADFNSTGECGILICGMETTLVYLYDGAKLHVWLFKERERFSEFLFYTTCDWIEGKKRVAIDERLLFDEVYLSNFSCPIERMLSSIINYIMVYVSVKKYGEVETIVIPVGKFTDVENTLLRDIERKKIINQIGQKVIVMDSRWFREIVNNNDISVRGFFRMQNFKNELGDWDRKLVYVQPYTRHGYHRKAGVNSSIGDFS